MSWDKILPFLRRKGTAEKELIDREYIEESISRSPVPIVLVLVLVWMVAAVLLLLSENRQRDLTVWSDGQRAPFSVFARMDFSYEDSDATAALREQARKNAPMIFRIVPGNGSRIKLEIEHFFSTLQTRETADLEKKIFVPEKNPGSELAAKVIDYKLLLKQLRNRQQEFDQQLDIMLRHGVGKDEQLADIPASRKVEVISADGRIYDLRPVSAGECAVKLADLLEVTGSAKTELTYCLESLLEEGNLRFDAEVSKTRAEKDASGVQPVIKKRNKGDLLVERRQLISHDIIDMLQAEKEVLPRGYGIVLLCTRLGLSFLLMMMALVFLYRTYPKIFQNPHRFSMAGLAMILALLANFGAIQLFFYFFRSGVMPEYDLMLAMIPVPFGAALLSILLGNRTALFAGFLVSSISALMILPDRSFELALRWFAIMALMALFTRDVSNYRSFFVRVFLGGALLTAVVNGDMFFAIAGNIDLVRKALLAVGANVFLCATAALLMVFAFELVFNVDTTMSLGVLSDGNHPLLNKLKREAPGTMFHSISVATLAEDAAKAIHANPARAKAGALFHDIGKLASPHYFVENNVDSPKIHDELLPQRSCAIIRGHVKDGLELAREYRLCRFIRDAIATHHGNDLISFFYRKAKEQNSETLESQFRYNGQPPEEKELTIISLADACEAACRSLEKPSPATIEKVVNNIFIGRLSGNQLKNSELTLQELDVVRKCFIEDLGSIYHARIAYNKEKENDTTALPVEESAPDSTPKK